MKKTKGQIIFATADKNESTMELAHRALTRKVASEGIVLLENNGVLPLKPCKVALYGAGAIKTIKGGTGSGEVNERYSVSILEGLKNAGYEISSNSWINDYMETFSQSEKEFAQEVRDWFKNSSLQDILFLSFRRFNLPVGRKITKADVEESNTDTAIYVVARQAGEGADRHIEQGQHHLLPIEIENLKTLANSYKNVILVINVGSSMDMSFLKEVKGISAVLFFCQQGEEGGNAFADVLSGKVSPSGRLTSTWAEKYEDIPFSDEYSYLNNNLDEEYYKEDIYVGYRYFDTFKVMPKYEFGYGLSYSPTKISVASVNANKTHITIDVDVKNNGLIPTKEVVQVYVSCPIGKINKEYQRLVTFKKTDVIAPGETERVKIDFALEECASYFEKDASFVLEGGDYIIRVGKSSRNTQVAAIAMLDGDAIVSKHMNICPPVADFEKLQGSREIDNSDYINAPIVSIKSSDVETIKYDYLVPQRYSDTKVDAIMEQLSTKDKVNIVVGAGIKLGGALSGSKLMVPGAGGYTTDKYYNKGLVNVVLSDGPAGLRISRAIGINRRGIAQPYNMMFDFLDYIPDFYKRFLCANPKKTKPVYQNCTAFPVALAVAQTWNTELALEVGEAVGEEMNKYGITYWLAPALNIHRNPLCGRNFEYYSEDPLLSGKIAAAVSLGVQKFPGTYVTIKHFCCNNQEENRELTNANVSERALREIYLKGFGIAVKEGGAKSIMTSYNKLNGTYTSNSYDLCTNVARNEWGFDGVIMTDWHSTNPDRANNAICMKVGNDLIMPGNGYCKKEILKGLKTKLCTLSDLDRCCANVIRSIVYSNVSSIING